MARGELHFRRPSISISRLTLHSERGTYSRLHRGFHISIAISLTAASISPAIRPELNHHTAATRSLSPPRCHLHNHTAAHFHHYLHIPFPTAIYHIHTTPAASPTTAAPSSPTARSEGEACTRNMAAALISIKAASTPSPMEA